MRQPNPNLCPKKAQADWKATPQSAPTQINVCCELITPMYGGGVMPGTDVVRVNWSPPDDDLDIDFVVIEYSEHENGPWDEIAAKAPDAGHYEHGAIFTSGKFHYYRVFLARGQEETPRTDPIAVWIPGQGALDRAGPGQVLPANRTPTPVPGSDAPPTPLPTISGDSDAPFMVVPPTPTAPPTPVP